LLFLREAVMHPRSIGAVLPSSPALGDCMANFVTTEDNAWTVELGAGTGVVTNALLARGISPRRLLVVERSVALANLLRDRFPGVRVFCEDAVNLRDLVRQVVTDSIPVQVVSSLPLRSLPAEQVRSIVQGITDVLGPNGSWVQFTYALAQRDAPPGFVRRKSRVVWQNVPPARVNVFTLT
jgi:phospholipid N-methyltransferase